MDIDLIHKDFLYRESITDATSQMNFNFPSFHPRKDCPCKANLCHIFICDSISQDELLILTESYTFCNQRHAFHRSIQLILYVFLFFYIQDNVIKHQLVIRHLSTLVALLENLHQELHLSNLCPINKFLLH